MTTTDAILNGETLALMLFDEPLDPAAYLRRFYPDLTIPDVGRVAARTVPLVARVNASIWIASCPCGAKGVPAPGGLVWIAQPLVWCVRCENAAVDGAWRPVVLPAAPEREAIEAILSLRPDPSTRNWEPGETVEDLMRQNIEHGDPWTEAA